MCVCADGDSDRDVSDGGIWPKDPYRDDITLCGGGGGGGFQQTMSSEYQCKRTALSTPGTDAPTLSSPHLSVSINPLLPAFYHGALTPVLFPPLPHVHTSFSQNSDCRMLIWAVPFPITVVPLPFQLQSLFVFSVLFVAFTVCVRLAERCISDADTGAPCHL